MPDTEIPAPPTDLGPRCAQLWREIVTEFEPSPPERAVLAEALTSLQRADDAAAQVRDEGLTVLDRYGVPKAHPAIDIEARHRGLFLRLIRSMDMDWIS